MVESRNNYIKKSYFLTHSFSVYLLQLSNGITWKKKKREKKIDGRHYMQLAL